MMNRPTIEQIEALEVGAIVLHAKFGECCVEETQASSRRGSVSLGIMSEDGKDLYEEWIRNGWCVDELNDSRDYVILEDEPLAEDGILEILRE